MKKFLTKKQIEELKTVHHLEDKSQYADRIKAILLLNSGWSSRKISEALLLDPKTIWSYKQQYEAGGLDLLCSDNYSGSPCKLADEQLYR